MVRTDVIKYSLLDKKGDYLTYTTQKVIAPADKTMIYRLVGSYEYTMALQYLEYLVNHSTMDEIKVYNKIIASRPEFQVYTQPHLYSRQSSQYNVHQGIEWVLAFARLELAGVLAAYSDIPEPFEMLRPTVLERSALNQLVLSDTAVHIKAILNDKYYNKMIKESKKGIGSETLAYLRRLKLITHFLNYSNRHLQKTKQPIMAKSFIDWSNVFRTNARKLLAIINRDLQRSNRTNTVTLNENSRLRTAVLSTDNCICRLDSIVVGNQVIEKKKPRRKPNRLVGPPTGN